MSAGEVQPGAEDAGGDPAGDGDTDPDVLAGELAVLREENRRLRRESARAKQSQYRQSAATLFGVGVLAFLAGIVVADARTVLFALGGTGVFLGILIYFLTPEWFLSASVGEAVYASLARNESQVVAELGLQDEWVYVPRERGDDRGSAADVRLFVPQSAEYEVPESDDLGDVFVVTENESRRGVSFRPTAADLYADFEQAVTGEPSDEPDALAAELGSALVEQFELIESATADGSVDDGRVAVRVSGSATGRVDRFDHPVASLLGVGIARAAGRPVTVTVDAADDQGATSVVICSWPGEEGSESADT